MAKKYLDYDGLSYFWSQIKGLFVSEITYDSATRQIQKTKGNTTGNVVAIPTATSHLTNDSGFITSADVPEGSSASTITPLMDGTASKGTDNGFARGDHKHPTDTSRAPVSHASTATTYGKGNDTKYGHVRLSDSYDSSIDNTKGTAATPKAVEAALEQANDYADGVAGDTNVLEGVQMNGADLTIDANKKVNIPLFKPPTSTVAGEVGLVPAPLYSNGLLPQQYMRGDGVWAKLSINAYTEQTDQKFYIGLSSKNGNSTSLFGETEIPTATTQGSGLMSSSDKSKLDSISMTNGVIDSSVLPSFVDDVIEAYARTNQSELGSTWLATGSATGTVITPEAGKIYVLMNSSTNYEQNTQFRWGGTAYVQLNDSGCTAITNAEIDTILAS